MQVSSTGTILTITKISAVALVTASTGFAATYAWRVGASVSTALALITCLFAVAADIIKPLSIGAAFNAFSSWSIGRGLALACLGIVAVAYSLTAELSLVSMSRGDLSASRAALGRQNGIQAERVEAARRELAELPATRSVAELEALIAGTSCHAIPACSKLVKLRAEHGRAVRKAELEGIINGAADTSVPTLAVGGSDPGASNLSVYLAALGIFVSAEVVSKWLALIPTLAIELGSALAVVLVNFISAQTIESHAQPKDVSTHRSDDAAQPQETQKSNGIGRLIQMSQLAMAPAQQANSNVIPYVARPKAHTRQSAEDEIVRQLKLHGSSAVFGAQRQMALSLRIDRSTFNRAATELARRGVINVVQDGNRVVMKLTA
jgi:hypothetical protein